MALLAGRIIDLGTYTQLASGEVGYVDPSTIFYPVDNSGWAKPKKMDLGQLLFSEHIEGGDLSTASVNITATYGAVFGSANYVLIVAAYKEVTIDGKVIRTAIQYYDLVQTTSGFTMTLEDKTDAVVRYFAYE